MNQPIPSRGSIREMIAAHAGPDRVPARFAIHTDTSDFFRVNYGDVVVLGGEVFWIRGYEREGRFGLDDEPKYWVRRAVHLPSGATRILKLVFHEKFETTVAGVTITCYRSPRKEARILDLVRDHPHFMHGTWIKDTKGNIVRILEYIPGTRLDDLVSELRVDHERYFHQHLPSLLDRFIALTTAIKFLHDHGEKHGDIRRDHILYDREAGCDRWIDFDYNYLHGESMFGFDLQGLGNILIYLVGQGDVLVPHLQQERPGVFAILSEEDVSLSYKNRVANLRKVYPYIPESLNRVLLHFACGTEVFYETTGELLEELGQAREELS